MSSKIIRAADLFCGAGGTSAGLVRACERLGRGIDLLAINHWEVAIETHSRNHPQVRHLCENLDSVNPRKVVPSGYLDLLVASPECTHHSIARGGKPMSDQSRASAWHVLRWAEALYIDNILVENVREFRDWRPLRKDGHPDGRYRKGHTYRAWLGALEGLGYRVEERLLRSADYGDPTTRQRLFVMARRGRRRIAWPESSHAQQANGLPGWRPAREIIDWATPGESIFTRKRPLAPNTIARIAAGLKKFGGDAAEPFLVMLYGTGLARSVDRPLPTVTAQGQHIGLCEPFLVNYHGSHKGKSDGDRRVCPVNEPLPTQDTANRFGLCEPFIVPQFGEREGQEPRTHSVDDPLPTVTGHGAGALVQPFLLPNEGIHRGNAARSVDDPVPTITASRGGGHLVEPFLMQVNHGKNDSGRPRDLDQPLPTLTSKNAHALIEPFILKYYGTGVAHSVDEPLDTVTTKDRFGLIEVNGVKCALDIRFRMLLVPELAAAMGFPASYDFAGNKGERVKQIGNAVSVGLGEALCHALLAG
jgi:DNA (cytosine-5)-methyltransferase 1